MNLGFGAWGAEALELADGTSREDQARRGGMGRMAGMCRGRGDPQEVERYDVERIGLEVTFCCAWGSMSCHGDVNLVMFEIQGFVMNDIHGFEGDQRS